MSPLDRQLLKAIRADNALLVAQAIEAGGDPNFRDSNYLTPLILCARAGRLAAARALVAAGADIEARDKRQRTALHHATAFKRGEFLDYLLPIQADLGAVDSHGWTAFDLALCEADSRIISRFRAAGAPAKAMAYKLGPQSPIGCFVDAGDRTAGNLFLPYVWQERGLFTLFSTRLTTRSYGPGLQLLLCCFYVEGVLSRYRPATLKLGRYSPKSRSISVKVPVTRDQFHNCIDRVRREFVVNMVASSVEIAADRLGNKLDFDFHALQADLAAIYETYYAAQAIPKDA